MGGDFAPHNEVAGALAALKHFKDSRQTGEKADAASSAKSSAKSSAASVEVVLFGRENSTNSAPLPTRFCAACQPRHSRLSTATTW
jgi:hypothetical protein